MNIFGRMVKERRLALNMSQDELAKKLNYKSRSSIQKVERGVSDIPQAKITEFAKALETTEAHLMGWDIENLNPHTIASVYMIPVVAEVKGGYNGIAYENLAGSEPAYDVSNPSECVWFKVRGASMCPQIMDGDLVLVRRQQEIESGDIAVVIYDSELGTVKKVIKHKNAITLMPINPEYEPITLTAQDLNNLLIYGKVIEIKRKL